MSGKKKIELSKKNQGALSPTRDLDRLLDEKDFRETASEDEPVGAPHQDEEPGSLLVSEGPGAWSAAQDKDAEDDVARDEHEKWQRWEERHARARVRLFIVVGATMAAIAAIWLLGISDMVKDFSLNNAGVVDVRNQFLEKFAQYEDRFDSLAGKTLATGSSREAAAFVESLKAKAVGAATSTK
jgi:hypothetical protein